MKTRLKKMIERRISLRKFKEGMCREITEQEIEIFCAGFNMGWKIGKRGFIK